MQIEAGRGNVEDGADDWVDDGNEVSTGSTMAEALFNNFIIEIEVIAQA